MQGKDRGTRYNHDVLKTDWRRPPRGRSESLVAEIGLVLEEVSTGWCGEIVKVDRDLRTVTLEDRAGRSRVFPMGPGFWLAGKPVLLTPPIRHAAPTSPSRSASGSFLAPQAPAQVARPSRIFVEGRHDAELIEKVWGDDLRGSGVVVEFLGGVDDLMSELQSFAPGLDRRVGVLVDHLVDGSKESRIAEDVEKSPMGPHVLIVGHPFVDIWAAVKPDRLGLTTWPEIPRNQDWKHGICQSLGWPHGDQTDLARAWRTILAQVSSYTDLLPELLGPVEQLIDFVTVEPTTGPTTG
jgi:hypothetical protein